MHIRTGWLTVGLFGLAAAAATETPAPATGGTQFDGICRFVSATKVSDTYGQ